MMRSERLLLTEARRWTTDVVLIGLVLTALILCAILSLATINAAFSDGSGNTAPVTVTAGQTLDQTSTPKDVIGLTASVLGLALPLAATLMGTRMAGSELRAGALPLLALASGDLRRLLTARLRLLLVVCVLVGGAAALAGTWAARTAVQTHPGVDHVVPPLWDGATMVAAAVQTFLFGVIAFGASVYFRRPLAVAATVLVYTVMGEPVLGGLLKDARPWLPHHATSALTNVAFLDAWSRLAPTALVAAVLALAALHSASNDRATR